MTSIGYARTPVVHRPTSEDDRPPWSATIPLEVALDAKLAPKAAAVLALVNHGRWVVSCPDCSSAQLACPSDRRFMCHECANIAIGVQWRPVIWPKDPAALSDALADRADRTMQNLDPGETVEQLLEQNEILAAGPTFLGPVQLQGMDYPDHHSHEWPKRVADEDFYVCDGCGARYDGAAIKANRGHK